MKYLKAKKKVEIFDKRGELVGLADVTLKITGRGYDDVQQQLSVNHTYTETMEDGTVNTNSKIKNVSFEQCNQLSLIVTPTLPNNLPDMEEQFMKVLIVAKQFFSSEYKGLTENDIEILEEVKPETK